MLTAERLRALVSYDQSTGVFIRLLTRAANAQSGSVAGWSRADGRRRILIEGRYYYAHRLAWLYMTGEWPTAQIDHINGDPADNRFINLREATRTQNCANIGLPRHNTSGLKGTTAVKGRWQAQIQVGGKKIYLGKYATKEEAHAAYLSAAKTAFGEFARVA